jgi:hypothetical protein
MFSHTFFETVSLCLHHTKHHRVAEVKYTKSHHQSLILLSALCCSIQSMIIMINAFCLLFSNLYSSYKRVLLVSVNRRHRFVRFVTGWGNAYSISIKTHATFRYHFTLARNINLEVFRFLSARNHPWILGVSIVATQNYAFRQKSGLKPQLI